MVGEGPLGAVSVAGPGGGPIGRERGEQRGDTAGGEPAPADIVEVDVVVAEQIGLDRVAMSGYETDEAEEFPSDPAAARSAAMNRSRSTALGWRVLYSAHWSAPRIALIALMYFWFSKSSRASRVIWSASNL